MRWMEAALAQSGRPVEEVLTDAERNPGRALLGRRQSRSAVTVLRESRLDEGVCGMRPRLSRFPIDKPFERLEPDAPVSEMVLRLVVDLYSEAPVVIGTATGLCRHLFVTARHVLESVAWHDDCRSVDFTAPAAGTSLERTLTAVQVLPGPEYVAWDVVGVTAHPGSDIALLQTTSKPRRSDSGSPPSGRAPRVNPFAPGVEERVAAFGYRRGWAETSRNAAGELNIRVGDEFMASVGIVRQIHDWGRDRVMMPFPCYQVSARFDAGMSGGPVFDEYGSLCGLVCSGVDGAQESGEPISMVTTLWPLFALVIDGDRGEGYPKGVRYPAIELARDGQIHVADRSRLMDWFRTHIDPMIGP